MGWKVLVTKQKEKDTKEACHCDCLAFDKLVKIGVESGAQCYYPSGFPPPSICACCVGGRSSGFGCRWSGRHAPAAAETADCRIDADPRPQLHAELDELPPTTDWRGKYPPGGCVGHSVGLPVELGRGIELSSLSALSRAVCACWASGFYQSLSITANGILGVSSPVRASRSVCGFVCACLLARLLPRVAPLIFPSVPSFVLVWAHAVIIIAGVVSLRSLLHRARTAAARSALFVVFGVCGCGVFF